MGCARPRTVQAGSVCVSRAASRGVLPGSGWGVRTALPTVGASTLPSRSAGWVLAPHFQVREPRLRAVRSPAQSRARVRPLIGHRQALSPHGVLVLVCSGDDAWGACGCGVRCGPHGDPGQVLHLNVLPGPLEPGLGLRTAWTAQQRQPLGLWLGPERVGALRVVCRAPRQPGAV